MKRLAAAWILLLCTSAVGSGVDPRVLEAQRQRVEVISRVRDSVLSIFSAAGRGGGSGVLISPDGYALTNFHVAKPCGNAMKCGIAGGEIYDAVIVGVDPTGDVALIKLFGRDDFPCAELGDSDQVRLGDWAIVMGNPFLLASDFQPTVTYGIISGVHRYQYPAGTLLEYADCLQTDASINPGNSGGPLFDAHGRLIGINGRASFEKRGRVNVGVGYAISINQIKNFLGYLRSGRIVDHATLGATVGFDAEGRVVVTDILEQSDAYRRGLRYDDEVLSFGGRPVLTPNGLKNTLGIFPKGWRVPLSFRRHGQRYDVLVRLAGLHTPAELWKKTEGRPTEPPMPIPEPEDKPRPERPAPGGHPAERPERQPAPIPIPRDGRRPVPAGRQAPMPPEVQKHFQKRQGFANYFFNKQHRLRVWRAWAARTNASARTGPWILSGTLEGGGRFRIEVDDGHAAVQLPAGRFAWTPTADFSAAPLPEGSGGLLPALFLWRRLAVQGIEGFGDVYYLGTAPLWRRAASPESSSQTDSWGLAAADRKWWNSTAWLAEPGAMADVLVGLHGGVECWFYFDPSDGWLRAVEFFPSDDLDPCEVQFTSYQEQEGRWLPRRIEVYFGDSLYGAFPVERCQLDNAPRSD